MSQQNSESTPTRKRASRHASVERRAAILAGALKCFDELGIDGTTISHIQTETGISVGSLYHHFGNKEGIAEALFIDGIQQFNAGMITRLKRTRSAETSVKAVVEHYCDWTADNGALARYLHARTIEFSDESRARLRKIHSEYLEQVFTHFTRYVVSGEMRALPLDTYVPLISGPVQEYTRRWLSGQSGSGASISKEMKALFADAAWKSVRRQARP